MQMSCAVVAISHEGIPFHISQSSLSDDYFAEDIDAQNLEKPILKNLKLHAIRKGLRLDAEVGLSQIISVNFGVGHTFIFKRRKND